MNFYSLLASKKTYHLLPGSIAQAIAQILEVKHVAYLV